MAFTAVAVLAVGSTIASSGFGRGAHARFHDAESKLAAECKSASTGAVNDPCAEEATVKFKVFPEFKIADAELRAATAAPPDRWVMVTTLVSVLAHADHIDRARTLFGAAVAGKLYDSVAQRIDADPALLDDPRITSAIRRSSFGSSRRPLQGERLHALTVLSRVPAQVPVRTMGAVETTATQAMADVDATFHEMESTALVGDLRSCEAAAAKPKGLARQVTVGPGLCKFVADIGESGQRFQRLQIRAAAHARRPSNKTARAFVTL